MRKGGETLHKRSTSVTGIERVANFLLVHGACHGGWCWERVTPLLKARGHDVWAPDLPGHGDDKTPLSALSLDVYAEAIARHLQERRVPVVLVGHSMAGAVISRVAETLPGALKRLVYLTAYMPNSGESLASLARRDTEALTASERVVVDGADCFTIPRAAARQAFYQDASDDTFEFALARIGPEPVRIFRDKADFTNERYGRVPRAYIHCTEDKAISYTLQREMVQAIPCERVVTLASGHSPFLTAPEALTEILHSLGE